MVFFGQSVLSRSLNTYIHTNGTLLNEVRKCFTSVIMTGAFSCLQGAFQCQALLFGFGILMELGKFLLWGRSDVKVPLVRTFGTLLNCVEQWISFVETA